MQPSCTRIRLSSLQRAGAGKGLQAYPGAHGSSPVQVTSGSCGGAALQISGLAATRTRLSRRPFITSAGTAMRCATAEFQSKRGTMG